MLSMDWELQSSLVGQFGCGVYSEAVVKMLRMQSPAAPVGSTPQWVSPTLQVSVVVHERPSASTYLGLSTST